MPRKTNRRNSSRNLRHLASMRPRPDAAENLIPDCVEDADKGASMRPRPDAAENEAVTGFLVDHVRRFNEAAARCRGKRRRPAGRGRPRRCFNEAAARCRGKRAVQGRGSARKTRFNEAAARCRGKPGAQRLARPRRPASMRPRPDAAENVLDGARPPLTLSLLQ